MSKRDRRHKERRKARLAAGAGVAVGAGLMLGNGTAQAACNCTVDSLADPTDAGHTTLRDALLSAETSGNSGSTITFASGLTGTIHLASQLPEITYPTTIEGPGPAQLVISGESTTRLFYMYGTDGDPVTISGLTLAAGYTKGPDPLRNGGAIFDKNMDLSVENSVFSGNTSLGDGTHDGYGGAICVCSGPGALNVLDSTFSGNTAGGSGGAIYSDFAPVTINSSTLDGNQSYYRGGAVSLYNPANASTIENSTVSGNSTTGTGTSGLGGAVYRDQNAYRLTVWDSTLAGNHANHGGGVLLEHSDGLATVIQNSIVANDATTDAPDLAGSPFQTAFSLIRDGTNIGTESVPGSDITGQDPQLGGLANNGGATSTMLPASTSPVINKGSAFSLNTDQRGLPRPIAFPGIANSAAAGADGSDIGAVELQLPASPTSPATPTKKKKCKRKKHRRSAQSAKKKKCKKKKKR
jgi:predicted outer membrane repeat protein